jgi:hypothetical protein
MMAHPPELAEDLVGWFLPPACREEVLGDLWESCKNPVQYTMSALAVVPRVIFSQIRRNTDSWVLLLSTFAVAYSFSAGSASSNPAHPLLRLTIPSVPAILALLIRNGYASAEERRQRAITFDIVIAIGVAALTQLMLLAAFRSDLMLRGWWPSEGTAFSWLSIIVLRAIFPPRTKLSPTYRSLQIRGQWRSF